MRNALSILLIALAAVSAAHAHGQKPTGYATLCSSSPAPTTDIEILCSALARFSEPNVPLNSGVARTFRLVYDRSFDPSILIRIDVTRSGRGTISARELTIPKSEDDITPVSLDVDVTIPLTQNELAGVLKVIEGADFWHAPSEYHLAFDLGPFGKKPANGVIMNDGAIWIIEGMTRAEYKVMIDDGGAFESPVRDIGLAMLELAKRKVPALKIEPIY